MWNHIKRAFLPITLAMPNQSESAKLAKISCITEEGVVANYCVWRQSNLILSCLSISISIVLGIKSWKLFNPFSILFLTIFLASLLPIYYLHKIAHKIDQSSKVLGIGCIESFGFLSFMNFFILQRFQDKLFLDQIDLSNITSFTLIYSHLLSGCLFGCSSSIIRGFLQTKYILPHSNFKLEDFMFLGVIFVLIDFLGYTIASKHIFILRSIMMIQSIIMIQVYRSDADRDAWLVSLISVSCDLGIFLLIVHTGIYSDGKIEYIMLFFEWFGRMLMFTVYLCDFIIAIEVENWINTEKNSGLEQQERNDIYEDFYRVLKLE